MMWRLRNPLTLCCPTTTARTGATSLWLSGLKLVWVRPLVVRAGKGVEGGDAFALEGRAPGRPRRFEPIPAWSLRHVLPTPFLMGTTAARGPRSSLTR